MPRIRDLTGETYGALVVLALAPGLTEGGRSRWHVRCGCGREETAPQNRLTGPTGWRACTVCRRKPCVICGTPIDTPTNGRAMTCPGECRQELKRRQVREAKARKAADPERWGAFLAKLRADRVRPDRGAVIRAAEARKRRRFDAAKAADPALADADLASKRASRGRVRLRRMLAEGTDMEKDL